MTGRRSGRVVWVTGLSGAGKSSLATAYASQIRGMGETVVVLDGDELRDVLCVPGAQPDQYSRDFRLGLAMRYARLAKMLSSQGLTVVVATISMFAEVYSWNRKNFETYFEVYLKTPLDVLKDRDPKSLYARFDQGLVRDVAGLDLPIDEPINSDWIIEHDLSRTVDSLACELVERTRWRVQG